MLNAAGVSKGNYDSGPTSSWDVVDQVAVGFIPVIGQIADDRDIFANAGNVRADPTSGDAWRGLGLAGIGLIPGIGDGLKGAVTMGKEVAPAIVKNADEAIDNASSLRRIDGNPEAIECSVNKPNYTQIKDPKK